MKNNDRAASWYGIALMVLCSLCLCLGQFIWKYYNGAIAMLGGFIIYGIGALAMISAYKFGNLSVLQPINSVSYIFSSIIGVYILNEPMSQGNILGVTSIIIGVIILSSEV